MSSTPWLIIGIGVLIILFAVIAWQANRIKKRPVDYYTFFIIGIIWLPFGIATGNTSLWMLGLIFTVIGLAHRSEWKKNRVRWCDLTEEEKRFKRIIIIALTIVFVLGIVVNYIASKGII